MKRFLNFLLNLQLNDIVLGQKYASNEMKIVISNILRKTKIETYGKIEDIQVREEVVIGIESVPEVKFFEI